MKQIYPIRAIFLILLLLSVKNFYGQDVTFSHFLFSPIFYNPAATGIDMGINATIDHRKDLMYLPSKIETSGVGVDWAIHDLPVKGLGGVGFYCVKNQEGEGNLQTTSIGIPVSARVDLSENWVLQAGVAPVFYQKRIVWDNFVFSDQLNPYYGIDKNIISAAFRSAKPKIGFNDFSAGIWSRWTNDPTNQSNSHPVVLDLGFSVQHVPEPNQSFFSMRSIIPTKYIFVARYSYSTDNNDFPKAKIQPVFLYEMQGSMKDFILGSNFVYSFIEDALPSINIGTYFRREQNGVAKFSEIILMAGTEIYLNKENNSTLNINFSTDLFLETNKVKKNYSPEVSVIFHFPTPSWGRCDKVYKGCSF